MIRGQNKRSTKVNSARPRFKNEGWGRTGRAFRACHQKTKIRHGSQSEKEDQGRNKSASLAMSITESCTQKKN